MAAKRKVVLGNKVVKNSNIIKNSLKSPNINQIPRSVLELCESTYIKCQAKSLEPHLEWNSNKTGADLWNRIMKTNKKKEESVPSVVGFIYFCVDRSIQS